MRYGSFTRIRGVVCTVYDTVWEWQAGSRSHKAVVTINDQDDLHSCFDFAVNGRLVHAIILCICSIRFLLATRSLSVSCVVTCAG